MEMVLKSENNPVLPRYSAAIDTLNHQIEKPLAILRAGESGVVSRMTGDEEFRSKMLALGILPGKTIMVARGGKHQPFILRIDESRIMVDWNLLSRIYILSDLSPK